MQRAGPRAQASEQRGARGRAVVALAVPALAACAPALDWREVRPPGAAVVATMPCRPNVSTRIVPLAGRQVRLTLLACKADRMIWALAAADAADPAQVGPALVALRESTRQNLEGQIVDAQPVVVPGATPQPAQSRVQVRGKRQDGSPARAEMVVFAHGTQVFQAVVMGDNLPAGPVATFFESLRAGA